MKGIDFVVDGKGDKKAVIIDLKKYGDLWEDLSDSLLAYKRSNEPRKSLEPIEQKLKKKGRLRG